MSGSQVTVAWSSRASVSAVIRLTEIAMPADAAVAPPCWLEASEIASPPAMAKIFELSWATTRTLPFEVLLAPAVEMLTWLCWAPAWVFVSMSLTDTDPATDTAPERPVGGAFGSVLCPAAELPAPPAAAEMMLPAASAEIFSVGAVTTGAFGFSGSMSSKTMPPPSSARLVSLTKACVVASISL